MRNVLRSGRRERRDATQKPKIRIRAATAGQQCWISIATHTGQGVNNDGWAWATCTGLGDDLSISSNSGTTWQTPGSQFAGCESAFRLIMPSPPTLIALGLGGLVGVRRRR